MKFRCVKSCGILCKGISKRSFDAIFRMSSECAKQLFYNVSERETKENEPLPEKLLTRLQYNPIAVAYAGIFFKYQIEQSNEYSYQDLLDDIENALKQVSEANTITNDLLNIQTTCVTLATKVISDSSPKLLHVFDLLGSCNVNHMMPLDVLLCHFNVPEFHVQLQPDSDVGQANPPPNEDDGSTIKVGADLESEQSVWSVHGIVSQGMRLYERIKLEVDALKSLFGYGGELFGGENKTPFDGLDFVRTCPLLITSKEPRAG